jgi:amino acid transporter
MAAGFAFFAPLAGVASPFAMLSGTVICFLLAMVIGDFTHKLPSAGSAYTFVANAFDARAGFVAGVSLFGAYIALMPFTAFFGLFTSSYLETLGIRVHWSVFVTALFVLATTLTVLGVQVSLRAGLVTLAFELVAFAILAAVIIVRGGEHGHSAAPFNPLNAIGGTHGTLLAIVFAIFAFAGFESAATLGEESANSSRTVPRALLITTALIGTFYVLVTYSAVIGFGTDASGQNSMIATALPFNDLAVKYVGPLLSTFITLAVMSSFVACYIAMLNSSSRMLYAMGRDKLVSSIFGRTNGRGTPYISALVIGAIGVTSTVAIGLGWGPENAASWSSFSATVFFIVAYALMAISLPRFYLRSHRSDFRVARHILVPLVVVAALGLVAWGNLYPLPPAPLRYFIVGIAVVIASAALAANYMKLRRPDVLAKAGQIFTQPAE